MKPITTLTALLVLAASAGLAAPTSADPLPVTPRFDLNELCVAAPAET